MNVIASMICVLAFSFPFWGKPAAPPTKPVKILNARSANRTTTVTKGDKFQIRLTHQPGTGYALKMVDNEHFKLKKYSTEPRKGISIGKIEVVGNVEVVVYEIEAIKTGHTTLVINHMAPGKDTPTRVYNYKFIVKPE